MEIMSKYKEPQDCNKHNHYKYLSLTVPIPEHNILIALYILAIVVKCFQRS